MPPVPITQPSASRFEGAPVAVPAPVLPVPDAFVVVVVATFVAVVVTFFVVVVVFATTLAFVQGSAFVLFWPALQVGGVFNAAAVAAYAPKAPHDADDRENKKRQEPPHDASPQEISFASG
jgi:hypothetical protein